MLAPGTTADPHVCRLSRFYDHHWRVPSRHDGAGLALNIALAISSRMTLRAYVKSFNMSAYMN